MADEYIKKSDAIIKLMQYVEGTKTIGQCIDECKSFNLEQTNYKEFCEWVANEIFSEEWEYNKNAFEELACRKLNKLDIVARIGGEWYLRESEGKE